MKKKVSATIDVYPEDTMYQALMQVLTTEKKELADVAARHAEWRKKRREQRKTKRQGRRS